MNDNNRYESEKQGTSPMRNSWDDPGFDMLLSPGDSALFGKISEYMKGLLDIEDVKSDPAYASATDIAVMMIAGYRANSARNKDNERFINDSLAEQTTDERLRDEINQIKHEIRHSNLNDISSEWVKEWHEKREENKSRDPKAEEIREFITGSIDHDEAIPRKKPESTKRSVSGRFLIIRYSSLAAAAVIGAVFLIRALLISGDTQNLFSKYYEPFNAVSDITRGTGSSGGSISFSRAIENYKSGDYLAAETGFSEAMLDETTSLPTRFFLGITEIELENPDKAIDLLGGVASRQGEYTKEARWYLGLAYLKSGNKLKASECFELLARSPGFYRERSEKILRRLR
jgi:TolA-binding protein